MSLKIVKFAILSTLVLAFETIIFLYITPGNFTEIPGATIVVDGTRCVEVSPIAADTRCADDADFEPESLPTIHRDPDAEAHLIMRMRFNISGDIAREGLTAIYLPKISDSVHISLNGQTIVDMGDAEVPPIRHWNAPVFVTLPESLIQASNELELTLSAYKPDGTMLHPFYVGPEAALKSAYQFRFLATRGVAYLAMAFMGFSGVLFGFLFLASRFRPTYGHLTLASISAFVFASHFAISQMPLIVSLEMV